MKINVIGWYDQDNIGENAFKEVISAAFSNHELVFSNSFVEGSERVILGAGGVFTPNYLQTVPKDIPVYALGVDLVDYFEGANAERMKEMTTWNIKEVLCRDKCDVTVHKPRFNISYIPDIAFNVLTNVEVPRIPSKKRKLAVILSDSILPSFERSAANHVLRLHLIQQEIKTALNELRNNWDIYFIPFCKAFYLNDYRAALYMASMVKDMGYDNIITELNGTKLTPATAVSLLSQFDCTLTYRFHGMIMSVMAGTPFVSIAASEPKHDKTAYDMGKNARFCSEHEMKYAIAPFYEIRAPHLINAVERSTKTMLRTELLKLSEQLKLEVQTKLCDAAIRWVS